MKFVASLKRVGFDKKGCPVYGGTVGDPDGIEMIVAGITGEWHVMGIRGFGVGFPGSQGHTLTSEAIQALDKAAGTL